MKRLLLHKTKKLFQSNRNFNVNRFNSLSIRLRIILSFSIVLLLLIVMSIVMFNKMNGISKNDQQIKDLYLPVVIEANKANNEMLQTSKHVNEMATLTMSVSQKKLTKDIETSLTNIEASRQKLKSYIDQFKDQELNNHYNTFIQQWSSYEEIAGNVINEAVNGQNSVAKDETYKSEAYFDRANRSMNSVIETVEQKIKVGVNKSVELNEEGIFWIFIISISSILFTILLIYITILMITKPLSTISNQVEQVASGNFTVSPVEQKTNDELGKLTSNFNMMTMALREVLKKVIHNIKHVTQTAEQIAYSASETKEGVSQVAVSVEEISSDTTYQLEKISEVNQQMGDTATDMEEVKGHIKSVNSLSDVAIEKAQNGKNDIDTIISKVNEMESRVHVSVDKLGQLVDKTKKIDSIVSVINNLSSQTNLLALNATIEAARAGENGKGFAVVADEVRKLAKQSADSTEKISTIIQTIQSETDETMEAMQKTSESTENGKIMITKTGESFDQIVESTSSVSKQLKIVVQNIERVAERTNSVVENLQGVDTISRQNTVNVETVAGISEETNASMEEITNAFLNLSEMSEQLNNKVKNFTVD